MSFYRIVELKPSMNWDRLRNTFIGMLGLGMCLIACSEPEQTASPDKEQDTGSQRTTSQGEVIGFADTHETYGWMGIPFAAPPVNELRWKAPRPPEERQDMLNATAAGNACIQLASPMAGGTEASGIVGSEDCLYLNIWAPQDVPTEGLPVMVWIHGGGNTLGTASSFTSMPELVGPQKVVVVSLNYRLGVLGWFSHPALKSGDSLDDSGNYGTLDLIQGLAWINENIAAFGGDPDRVTIFGESAGGVNVFSLLVAEQARGLFHRAIIQSGMPSAWNVDKATGHSMQSDGAVNSYALVDQALVNAGRADSLEAARALQQKMPAEEVREFLYGLTHESLIEPVLPQVGEGFPMYPWSSIIADGVVIPSNRTILESLQNAETLADVPVIMGTNRDEVKLFQFLDPKYVRLWFGMFPTLRDKKVYERDARYSSDMWHALGATEPAQRLAALGSDSLYTYRFDWDEFPSGWPVNMKQMLGAAHGMEIGFVLGSAADLVTMFKGNTKENAAGRKLLAEAMQEYWAEFAYTGNPGRGRSGSLPEWQSWPTHQNSLILDTDEDGGIRMEDTNISIAGIKNRLSEDASFEQEEGRCREYARLFHEFFQGSVNWQQEEYENFGEGCKDVPLTGVN